MDIIAAVVEMKRHDPRFRYMRITRQFAHAFGVQSDNDVVRRVLAIHRRLSIPARAYRPK